MHRWLQGEGFIYLFLILCVFMREGADIFIKRRAEILCFISRLCGRCLLSFSSAHFSFLKILVPAPASLC